MSAVAVFLIGALSLGSLLVGSVQPGMSGMPWMFLSALLLVAFVIAVCFVYPLLAVAAVWLLTSAVH
jgi:hypothetical protein